MNQEASELIEQELFRRGQPSASTSAALELLEQHRITPSTELPPMKPLFQLFEVPCFYRGELVAICGKAKSGKTLFLSTIMACALNPESSVLIHQASCVPMVLCKAKRQSRAASEQSSSADIGHLKVLWLDTEQSQQSTQDIIVNRLLPLSGISPETTNLNDWLYSYNLRGLGYEKRRELMELSMNTIKPDLAIIDGIKDLVTDINDAVQATLLMEQLMALAQQNNCCIVCVLHQNKSEADHNMRGSIGTELTNKAFEVYQCSYLEESDTFKVKQSLSRRNRIKRNLYYRLNDKGLPVSEQPRDAQGRWISKSASINLKKLFTDAMEGRSQRPFNEVMAVALNKCGVINAKAYYSYISEAEELGIVRKQVHPETGKTWVELCDNPLPF